MQPSKPGLLCLALCAVLFTAALPARAAIQSNFDDQIYPGSAGNGWTGGWSNSIGSPVILTTDPLAGNSPYVRLDATGGTIRNLMRQFESGEGVGVAAPHYIRWKFRLNDAAFDTAFTVFNDRVHFFGRNAARLTASTDPSINWSLMAAGAANAGAVGGKTFWIFDNVDGTGLFNAANHVDTLIPLTPGNIYSFEIFVDPQQLTYTVAATNETTSTSFKSAAPHRFRNLAAPGAAHTFLHFGLQTSAAAEVRAFDLDSVSIAPWGGPIIENVAPEAFAIHTAAEGIQFKVAALSPVPQSAIGLVLNGSNVTAQLNITGVETNWTVAYAGLAANAEYEMVIAATNAEGFQTLTGKFYTATAPFALYDSEGFTNNVLYPVGPLTAVTHGRASWEPQPLEPSEIRDDPADGKVLDRENWVADRSDFLHLPPVSSGLVVIQFDARVSRTDTRTFDVSLMPMSGTLMSSLLGWGVITNKLAHFDGTTWQPLADLDTAWHNYKLIHYLSGPAAGYYDIIMDGSPLAERLPWANAIAASTAFSRFRLHSHPDGALFEYGRLDNLVLTAAPEDPNAFPPPLIVPISPLSDRAIIRAGEGLRFGVTSPLPVTAANIGVWLNGQDVSSSLQVSGPGTDLAVAYPALQAETNYAAQIAATNTAGNSLATLNFIATEQAWLYDPSDGWAGPWQYTSGMPGIRRENPLAPAAPYIRLDILGGGIRNLMRQHTSGAGVDLAQPHFIRWKFRLSETDFAINFTTFNDRVHFFGRNAPRLAGSTDAANSWAISATGNEQTAGSGVSAGQKFYIFDNLDGTRAYNLANLVDSQIQLFPENVYAFELLIFPQEQTYSVAITNETSGAWFRSTAPHKFRAADVTAASHALLHFGTQADLTTDPRPFDFGPLSISSAAPPRAALVNPGFSGGNFSFSFHSQDGVHYEAEYIGDLRTSNWTALETIPGDGSVKTVTHTNPPAGPLFYRVRSQ